MARESRDVGLDSNLDRDIGISDEQDGTLRGNDSLHEVEQDTREKVYPAPLAGVEPLGGHAMHPDGDEQSVEDAERKARSDRQTDSPTMELAMTDAQLEGMHGLGVLREVQDSEGGTATVPGSWRPRDVEGGSPGDLDVGHTVRFEGPLHRADGSVQHVVSDVLITSIGEYTTYEGELLLMVNFRASEPSMLTHAAPDDGTLPPG